MRAIGRRRRTAVTAALLVGTFLAAIETTVVATAMPTIVERLGGFALYPWVFSAYLLAQTVTIPIYGRLADLYGRRAAYVGGIALFLVGTVLCGLAPSMPALVAARAVQGLGAGSVLPLTMTIFGDLYEVSARTKLQGLFSLVWGVSSVAGPLAGGAIVAAMSWRWVFLLTVPFGLVAATAVGLLLGRESAGRRAPVDLGGAATLAGSTLLLLVALLPAEQRPWALPAFAWGAASATLAVAFVVVERRHRAPLVPFALLRDRVQVAVNGAGLFLGVVLFGVVGYVPLYVQAVLGGSPVAAGTSLIPLSIAWTAASIVGGRVVRRVGFRALVRAGGALIGAGGLVGLAGVELGHPFVALGGTVLFGLGMGVSISSFTVSVQERAAPAERGIATALSQFSRSIGGAVGVAALGAVLASQLGSEGGRFEGGVRSPEQIARLAEGLRAVFVVLVGAAAAAALLAVALFPRVGVDQGRAAAARRPGC